jgi:hypothetical protein
MITNAIQSYRAKRAELNRQRKIAEYDHLRLNRSCHKTIGQIKAERLSMKNSRRAANGLPPKTSYAEI